MSYTTALSPKWATPITMTVLYSWLSPNKPTFITGPAWTAQKAISLYYTRRALLLSFVVPHHSALTRSSWCHSIGKFESILGYQADYHLYHSSLLRRSARWLDSPRSWSFWLSCRGAVRSSIVQISRPISSFLKNKKSHPWISVTMCLQASSRVLITPHPKVVGVRAGRHRMPKHIWSLPI